MGVKKEKFYIGRIPAVVWGEPSGRLYLYVHGQGGDKEEAGLFAAIACGCGWQVLSVDLPGHGERKAEQDCFDPWHIVPELREVMEFAVRGWGQISLFALSIGAWFTMQSFTGKEFQKCLFVSPVVDMARLITRMMEWADVSEAQLEKEGVVPTFFGQTLSWEYRRYTQEHPVEEWQVPTDILYGSSDHMIERESVEFFACKFGCSLTVMKGGEHWFHTEEQMDFMEKWARERLRGRRD